MAETRSDGAVLRAVSVQYDTAVASSKAAANMIQGVAVASKASFSGDASVAFNATADRQHVAQTAHFATVDAVGKAIHAAAGKYDVSDEEAKTTFTTIRAV